MNTSAVMVALRTKFAGSEYALLTEVANATGGRATRSADALVMNLWPSRGLTLAGYEVKASRSDWLRELKDPSKAEAICKFCDFWWVVAAKDDLVRREEVPLPWGFLVLRGEKLFVVKEPIKLEAQPVSRGFLAALLRRATEQLVPKSEIDELSRKRYQEGLAAGRSMSGQNATELELQRLKSTVSHFEKASGVKINSYDATHVGQLVRHVMAILPPAGRENFQRMVEQRRQGIASETQTLDALVAEYTKLGDIDGRTQKPSGLGPLPDPESACSSVPS